MAEKKEELKDKSIKKPIIVQKNENEENKNIKKSGAQTNKTLKEQDKKAEKNRIRK